MSSIDRVVAVLLVGAMLSVAERGVAARSDAHALLDVPYVSQTPELCGGAAVAMVLRYWGERGVFPQDFAALVSAGDGGILTGSLVSAVRDRGWQALVMPVAPVAADTARTLIRSEIDRGRPLIALIEVAPRTYHYVVIVGGTDREVVLHDPARAPFRVLPWAEFDRAWSAAARWMMLVLPPSGFPARDEAARATPASTNIPVNTDQTPCGALVEHGVQMALSGDREGADQELVAATTLCPDHPASWRELAGLRFSQSRWSEARDLALSAVRLEPDDDYSWQLVATSRYLMGDVTGALEAWNRTGEPRIDTIDIHGAERTPHPVIARAAGFQPRQVLTPEVFGRALRRLRELPVASSATMKYELIVANNGNKNRGLAKLDVFIDERPVVPRGWTALATLAGGAWLLDELRVDVAGALGAGELASAAWRWQAERRRVALELAVPSAQWLPGIVSIGALWERQSYDTAPGEAGLVREERRSVGLRVADWSTSWLRWETGASLDRLREHDDLDLDGTRSGARDHLAVESTLDARLAGDRLALSASGGWWAPFGGGNRFGTGGLLAAWRSTGDTTLPYWSAVTGIAIASRVAPLALWHGAGTGQGRGGLLRAHPLLEDNVLTGQVFGRDVANASFEYVRPVRHTRAGTLSIAGFVDAARAWHRLTGLDASPLYVDAGTGVRVHSQRLGGAIRLDIAHGLRGGGTEFSASWGGAWPR